MDAKYPHVMLGIGLTRRNKNILGGPGSKNHYPGNDIVSKFSFSSGKKPLEGSIDTKNALFITHYFFFFF